MPRHLIGVRRVYQDYRIARPDGVGSIRSTISVTRCSIGPRSLAANHSRVVVVRSNGGLGGAKALLTKRASVRHHGRVW